MTSSHYQTLQQCHLFGHPKVPCIKFMISKEENFELNYELSFPIYALIDLSIISIVPAHCVVVIWRGKIIPTIV